MNKMETMLENWTTLENLNDLKIGIRIKACLDGALQNREGGAVKWFTGVIGTIEQEKFEYINIGVKRDDHGGMLWYIYVMVNNRHLVKIFIKDWDN
jgi:hypothetical protein